MASAVASRKKSIASAGGVLSIDIPVVANTILNKSASQSTSLYQQCSQLRDKLMRIHDFPPYLALASRSSKARQSTDPVHQLWGCLSFGVPLCFLFNLLAINTKIDINCDPEDIDLDPKNVKDKKLATAAFITTILKLQKNAEWEEGEVFTVSDLINDNNTNGFAKVIRFVTALVDRLPEHVYMENPMPASPPSQYGSQDQFENRPRSDSNGPAPFANSPATAQDAERRNIIREMLETERKYVGDLEVMQQFASQLGQRGIMDSETLHHMFPGLHGLLDFQQRFLISMEQTAELPWAQQQWGRLFSVNEDGFQVYEPYCAHYSNAADLVLLEESNLNGFSAVISVNELPAFLIKPVQRICKYPLLLESLVKASKGSDYPYLEELREGLATAKRVADKINEAQRRAENRATVKALEQRVEDWKGHHLSNFGELLLDDIFLVNKSDVDREYHVFLFEKIILCCKEAMPATPKKVGKSPSLLKKQAIPVTPLYMSGGAAARKRMTPLLLKGRIFLNNVTTAQPTNKSGQWSLQVWWRGDEDLEYFTLRCRTEEQLKLWESSINRLIKEHEKRRQTERAAMLAHPHVGNSTNPALPPPMASAPVDRTYSQSSVSTLPPYPGLPPPANGRARFMSYPSDEKGVPQPSVPVGSIFPTGSFTSSYNGSKDGFEADEDFDSDYGSGSYIQQQYPSSGRGTPMGSRRATAAAALQGQSQDRDMVASFERARARTEDVSGAVLTQWRNMPPAPAPTGALPMPPVQPSRPLQTRAYSSVSAASGVSVPSSTSEAASFAAASRPPLRSQFSSTRLRSTYESAGESRESNGRYISHISNNSGAGSSAPNLNAPPITRSRSASQPSHPSFSIPKQAPPPLPNGAQQWGRGPNGAHDHDENGKRGSGSSQSTNPDSSDYSPPHTLSPITPYGSHESTSIQSSLRPQRSQPLTSSNGISKIANTPAVNFTLSPPIKVKVHYGEDLFVISVPRSTEYDELIEKVGKKIRLCGPRREDQPLRVKYKDEDGDKVSLASNEDVQLAFESPQVTLYVV